MNSPLTTTFSSHQTSGPKYCQIIDLILADIKSSVLHPGDRIPSIKEASEAHMISRDTVEKAYRELSQRGILISVPGKGYYVKGNASARLKIMALLPKPDAEERLFYDAFLRGIGKQAVSHLFCFGQEASRFADILNHHLGDYDYYLIWPRFIRDNPEVRKLIRKIPQNKLIHLDEMIPDHSSRLASIIEQQLPEDRFSFYQSWEAVNPLLDSSLQLQWNQLLQEIAKRKGRPFEQQSLVMDSLLRRETLYFVWEDKDLTQLLRMCVDQGLVPGKDLGIISLTEHPLKRVLAGGITTLSLSAEQLGLFASTNILQHAKNSLPFEAILTLRASA